MNFSRLFHVCIAFGETVYDDDSVVDRDIPADVVAVGNPCRVLRPIEEKDREYYYRDKKIDRDDVI